MQPRTPLWEAWLAFVTQQAMGQPTYVLYDPHDGEAFIQVRYRPHQAAADVAYLAPSLTEHQRVTKAWSHLLDGACIVAADQGIQRMFASLPASSDEADVFQHAGFTLYAEEDVYQLARQPASSRKEPPANLRAQRPEDWPALQKLCVAITPQRVRQAEGGIALTASSEQNCQRYVLPSQQGNDLIAALTICFGGLAHWMHLQVHPEAQHLTHGEHDEPSQPAMGPGLTKALIDWGLGILADQPAKHTFCSVRLYENGIREDLRASGFEPYARRSLMVKHTVAWVKTSAQDPVSALKSSAEVAPPAYRIEGKSEATNPDGRLAAETQGD
jgi:hypothetical protein